MFLLYLKSNILSVACFPFPASDRRLFLKSVLIQRQRTSSIQGTWIQSVVSKRHRSTWAPTNAGIHKRSMLFALGCWSWFQQWEGLFLLAHSHQDTCLKQCVFILNSVNMKKKHSEKAHRICYYHFTFDSRITPEKEKKRSMLAQNQKQLLISISRTANLCHYNFHDASKRECFGHNSSFELNH